VNFSWPGENISDGALLRLSPSNTQATMALEYSNTWGVLRLFQKAKLKSVSKTKFRAIWHLKGRDGRAYSVTMFIRGSGRNSILNALLFHNQSLPRHLFSTNKEEIA
jgi:type VI protein secretion system component VasK